MIDNIYGLIDSLINKKLEFIGYDSQRDKVEAIDKILETVLSNLPEVIRSETP